MGNLTINSVTANKGWNYTEDGWKLTGNSQHPTVNGNETLSNFSCNIYKVVNDEDRYVGDANGGRNGDGIKININNVPTADLAAVALVVENLVAALSE